MHVYSWSFYTAVTVMLPVSLACCIEACSAAVLVVAATAIQTSNESIQQKAGKIATQLLAHPLNNR
eukprot:16351-Heterococcus_DN1.PRE.1